MLTALIAPPAIATENTIHSTGGIRLSRTFSLTLAKGLESPASSAVGGTTGGFP
jgi:hypothetical protein